MPQHLQARSTRIKLQTEKTEEEENSEGKKKAGGTKKKKTAVPKKPEGAAGTAALASALAPREVLAGQAFMLSVWIYPPVRRLEVLARGGRQEPDGKRSVRGALNRPRQGPARVVARWPRGASSPRSHRCSRSVRPPAGRTSRCTPTSGCTARKTAQRNRKKLWRGSR